VQLKIWNSFDFEVLALFFNACLLFFYKSGASRDETEKLGYFNNSLFLKQYRKIQHVFFAAIVFDACFALTFIQMIMLAFTFGLLIIWAKLGNKQTLDDNGDGFVGFVHQSFIDHYLSKHADPEEIEFYFCGPPMMNKAVVKMCDDWGVPKEHVAFDDFGG
jgi:Na+-transporting NADH:ubiquinone oxidoreductase subunit NqrF